jgi:hypothetical protein
LIGAMKLEAEQAQGAGANTAGTPAVAFSLSAY